MNLAGPAFNGILSGAVPANQQGELMGARASLDSIVSIMAPLLMTGLFKYFTSGHAFIYFAGAAFAAAALFELAGVGVFALARPRTKEG